MNCETGALHPTLWRTCRILAHVNRLACLKVIFEHPSSTVSDVAGSLSVPVNQASTFLRALQARGLIRAQRHSRWVRYAPFPDPLVPGSRVLLKALRQALLARKDSEADIKHTLTGFTHLRRLAILARLQTFRTASAEALAVATQISLPAVSRHLSKLAARRLVRHADQQWRLAPPPDALARTLLRLIQTGEQEVRKQPGKTRRALSADAAKDLNAAKEQPLGPSRRRKG